MTYNTKSCWNYYDENFFQKDFLPGLQNYVLDFGTLKTSVLNGNYYNYFIFLVHVIEILLESFIRDIINRVFLEWRKQQHRNYFNKALTFKCYYL